MHNGGDVHSELTLLGVPLRLLPRRQQLKVGALGGGDYPSIVYGVAPYPLVPKRSSERRETTGW